MSSDAMMQTRLMSSGAGIVIGRTNDPEEAVKYAGTILRMEASGAASGDQLGTARAQHTYTLHPQTVRQAADGMFWLVQNGAVVPFRALPPTAEPTNANRPTEKDTGERTAEVDVQGDVSATSTVLTGEADGWGSRSDERRTGADQRHDHSPTEQRDADAGSRRLGALQYRGGNAGRARGGVTGAAGRDPAPQVRPALITCGRPRPRA